jgi:hypothetical protein
MSFIPSRQERVADGEESLQGHGDGAVDAAHEARLSDRYDHLRPTFSIFFPPSLTVGTIS